MGNEVRAAVPLPCLDGAHGSGRAPPRLDLWWRRSAGEYQRVAADQRLPGGSGGVPPPPGVTLISLIDRNIAHAPDWVAYRYLDFTGRVTGIPSN